MTFARLAAAAPWSWGELAQASPVVRAKRATGPRGPRRVSQETVNALREDAKRMTLADAAAKHGVSRDYAYQIVELGLRSSERERLR